MVFYEVFLNDQLCEVGLHITHVRDCLCSITGLNPSVTWPHLVFKISEHGVLPITKHRQNTFGINTCVCVTQSISP